ncbi:MAG TPA: Uma2 family endonuclease [Thermoanaerobaculia bacterium]|jgi:Uma2 family endonuclease
MVTIVDPRLTYEDLRALPDDGRRYELIDGEVFIAPAPRPKHQRTVGRLYRALADFVEERGLGEVLLAPTDVVFGERTAVQPDLLFIRKDRASLVTELNVQGAPDLVIEVLSPSNAKFDRETKLQVYARAGVRELWYFDPESRTAEVLELGGDGRYVLVAKLSDTESIRSNVLSGLSLPLADLFPA